MTVIQPIFDIAFDFSEGLAAVGTIESADDSVIQRMGYIDGSGQEIVPLQYEWAGNFSEGLAVVAIEKRGNILFGYINRQGDTVVTHQYTFASNFSNGRALVLNEEDNFFGYIDPNGNQVINLVTMQPGGAGDFSEELAQFGVKRALSNLYYLKRYIPEIPITSASFDFSYIDVSGRIVINLEGIYDIALPFSEGLAVVASFQKTSAFAKAGFIDKTGSLVIDLNYEWASDFIEGRAVVSRRDSIDFYPLFGYIDQQGNEIISLKYGIAQPFSEGLAYVFDASFQGFIDLQGNEVLNLNNLGLNADRYDRVGFSENLVAVYTEDLDNSRKNYGYINKRGDVVIPLKYENARRFSEGFAAVQIEDKWGYMFNPLKTLKAKASLKPIMTWNQSNVPSWAQKPTINQFNRFGAKSDNTPHFVLSNF
jgi:hypothetical protein